MGDIMTSQSSGGNSTNALLDSALLDSAKQIEHKIKLKWTEHLRSKW